MQKTHRLKDLASRKVATVVGLAGTTGVLVHRLLGLKHNGRPGAVAAPPGGLRHQFGHVIHLAHPHATPPSTHPHLWHPRSSRSA